MTTTEERLTQAKADETAAAERVAAARAAHVEALRADKPTAKAEQALLQAQQDAARATMLVESLQQLAELEEQERAEQARRADEELAQQEESTLQTQRDAAKSLEADATRCLCDLAAVLCQQVETWRAINATKHRVGVVRSRLGEPVEPYSPFGDRDRPTHVRLSALAEQLRESLPEDDPRRFALRSLKFDDVYEGAIRFMVSR